MFTHSDVWRGIDRLAANFGYSASGLAKKAGLDPTSFNKSKRISPEGKPRWPSTESIAKILSVTGATMSDFFALIDADGTQGGAALAAGATIPVIGFAQAGLDGFFDVDGYPAGSGWDEVPAPASQIRNDQGCYALEVSGDSMEPLYREGDLLIVSPAAQLRRGDRVIVKTTGGEVLAKELIRQTASKIELKSLNPAFEDRALKQNEVQWIARVVWVSQ
ncbi:MAG: helix-turn-helix transcriptional regulator [Alphaproteobacteria bacterium]